VHLSTSSFERPVVAGPWVRTFALALAVVVLVLGGLELFWRSQGHVPSVTDDPDLWAVERHRLLTGGDRTLVLIGASRLQVDVSTATLHTVLPEWRLVNLSVDALHPLAVLKHVAEEDRFRGAVLCVITAPGFENRCHDEQQSYVEHYLKHGTLNNRLNRNIATFLQWRLVVLDPYLKPMDLFPTVAESGKLPEPRYLIMLPDRTRPADYLSTDPDRHYRRRMARVRRVRSTRTPVPPDEWLTQALEIEPYVEEIQQRGGRVVFARFPTTREHWTLDELDYPREQYWDRFAAATSADTLHFRDIEDMRGLDCPDGSHLDKRDTPAFTRALTREMIRLGVIRRESQVAPASPRPLP